MNNLKFRAYIKSIQKIVDVTEIDLNNKMATLDIATNEVCPEFSFWWKETELAFSVIEIMQSSGYKDKNGKEIFEGDIVKFPELYAFVDGAGETTNVSVCDSFNIASVVKKGNCVTLDNFVYEDGITETELDNHECTFDDLDFKNFEIIGNIYENKE